MGLEDVLNARELGMAAYNDGVDWRTSNPFNVEEHGHGDWLAGYWERHNIVMNRAK